jgi:SHS2 domain-containing protein
MSFETFDHTADVGLRITAADLPSLFSEAARGMFSLIAAELSDIQPTERFEIQLPADDLDALLRNWLAELLYLFHVRQLLLCRFEVVLKIVEEEAAPKASLSAIVHGEAVDRSRHSLDAEIKAVTWHGLRIEPHDGGWLAEVIVDY